MQTNSTDLKRLLPHGALSSIAKKLGVSVASVSQALKKSKPGNPAVLEALRMAKDSGAIEAEQTLASLAV